MQEKRYKILPIKYIWMARETCAFSLVKIIICRVRASSTLLPSRRDFSLKQRQPERTQKRNPIIRFVRAIIVSIMAQRHRPKDPTNKAAHIIQMRIELIDHISQLLKMELHTLWQPSDECATQPAPSTSPASMVERAAT